MLVKPVNKAAALPSDQAEILCHFQVISEGHWFCLQRNTKMKGVAETNKSTATTSRHDLEESRKCSVPNTPEFEQIIHYPDYPLGKRERNPCVIERSNLVNILQLVIKEVIDSSLKFGCQLDTDHIPLQHFFIVLEHILQHGIKKPKKGLLGPKKELWDLLQTVEKKNFEAVDITTSVRNLPGVKTSMGRARAWLRLALMQKNLSDYFKLLVEEQNGSLKDFYEPEALLRSEEAWLIEGLLVSLNVVDCNICVKEEDLDAAQGVIDFSLYLRPKKDVENDSIKSEESSTIYSTNGESKSNQNLCAILDQKTYIEELNRQLSTTVTNLESKVVTLTATNALMREDIDMSKKSLIRAQEENKRIMDELQRYSNSNSSSKHQENQSNGRVKQTQERDSSLAEAIGQRDAMKKELNLQMSMKAETEMAMKLLEKDVHDKQDTILELRAQLEDIKQINMELYSKLQECEYEITQKGEIVAKLEAKTQDISRMLIRLNTQ